MLGDADGALVVRQGISKLELHRVIKEIQHTISRQAVKSVRLFEAPKVTFDDGAEFDDGAAFQEEKWAL